MPDTEEAVDSTLAETYRQIADGAGYVSNLMAVIAHAPDGLRAYAALDRHCRLGLDLTPLQRELAILVALRGVHYGWNHRAPIARALGIPEDQLLVIHEGRAPRELPGAERALCDFAFEVAACRRVPPRVEEAVMLHFTPRQIVDIAMLTSFHMASAALIIALDVQLESPDALQLELQFEIRLAGAA
jgi:alkylhydroperoxidase family enzyme